MRKIVLALSLLSLGTAACSSLPFLKGSAPAEAGAPKPGPSGPSAAPSGHSAPDTTVSNNGQNASGQPAVGSTTAPKQGVPPQTEQVVPASRLNDIDILVNKEIALPSTYVPRDLVKPNVPFSFREDLQKRYMRREAARALEQLFAKAKKDGINLVGVSAYRSYERQVEVFSSNAKREGAEKANQTSALPGHSEHQTGLAIDVSCERVHNDLTEKFADTPEGKWLAQNAPSFGFIIRYPKGKEQITGYSYEPWHIRYVGVPVAKEIAAKGLTLEEYLLGVKAANAPASK